MILILLLYCVGIPLTAIFLSAPDDKGQIDRNEVIEHRSQWMERAGIALAGAAMVCYALIVKFDQSPWVIGPVVLAAWPLFSAMFRYRLNKLRGLHPCYVSPSNWYDWFFLRVAGFNNTRGFWVEHWQAASLHNAVDIRRAGRLAYITESILFAFCCWWMAQIIG